MNIIVFSKNRPAQLDLLFRSMRKHIVEYDFFESSIKVLYTFDQEYESGYDIVKELYPKVYFHREVDFKKDLNVLFDTNEMFTLFLCDDDVFKEDISIFSDPIFTHFAQDFSIYCISFRLGKNLTQSYMSQRDVPIPLMDNRNTWVWKEASGDWAYPNSVSGHIYRTADMINYVRELPYSGPNYFEGYMAISPVNKPLMICYDRSRCLSVPINRVQTVCDNGYGQIPADEINRMFVLGNQISLSNISGLYNISAHEEIKYLWESR